MKTPKGLEGCVASPAVWFHILQLEEELNQAVEDLRNLPKMGVGNCPVCIHYNHGNGDNTCVVCGTKGVDCWQWRGVPAKEG